MGKGLLMSAMVLGQFKPTRPVVLLVIDYHGRPGDIMPDGYRAGIADIPIER